MSLFLLAALSGAAQADEFDFDIQWCWDQTEIFASCPIANTTVYDDRTWEAWWWTLPTFGIGGPLSDTGTWRDKAGGARIVLKGGGGSVYKGTYDSGTGCYFGTLTNDLGMVGVWEGCEVP